MNGVWPYHHEWNCQIFMDWCDLWDHLTLAIYHRFDHDTYDRSESWIPGKKSMSAEYLNVWSNTWFPLRFKVRPTEK